MGSLGPDSQSRCASEPIAIIGMSSKFAGDATNTDKLWQMLAEGRSGWTEFPASRFRSEGVYHPNNERLNTTHVKGAHFLQEDVGLFDAAFFSYSSETASSLDPQYRLQLESAYEALENAGIPLTQIAGSNTSVFTGVFVHDYRDALLRDADNLPRLMATGTGVPMMSNRISHFFDLRGASMTIETACSSGMVATHQGIQSLRTGESDMSIVGGANLTLNPDMFKALGSAGFLSADGKSYAFDSRASGYGRGEGVATIVMKRLSDALAAGDPIRAVIRSSLLNQDGKTETITTPSLEAQIDLIRQCYARAGLDPRDTQYFEAHGTGTQAGDTVEARAIATVFSSNPDPLLIGSIKTNIGHTEAASGLASIIKTALALEKGVIPASINFEKPNPKLSLEDWHLRLVRQLQEWPAASTRRASINNFGYGGANAHIVIEDGASWTPSLLHNQDDTSRTEVKGTESRVLVLSGKDEQACRTVISNLAEYLQRLAPAEDEPARLLDSLAYTLGQRRTRFSWVAAHPVPVTEGIEAVVNSLQSPKFKPYRSSRRPRIGMVFTGQGAQWWAMGRELRDAYPVYKASLDEADAYIRQFGADWSLVEELSRDAASSRINESGLSTPICVAVQISLVRLLESWGVVPAAVTSHSSGEIAAAYTVGALSYKDAMAYAYHRAVLAADTSLRGPVKGGMVAIGLGREETEAYLRRLTSGGKAMVACVNSPSSTTVSGDFSAVKELEELANADGVFARLLKVETAWHSHHMTTIADVYVEALDNIKRKTSRNDSLIAYSSPVTGGRVVNIEDVARPEHWVRSLVQPVQFVDAFTDMVLGGPNSSSSNVDVIVEVGPHTALGGPIQQILSLPAFKGLQIPYYGCLVRKSDAKDTMQALAANLLQQGYPVDMGAVNFPHGRGPRVKVLTGLPSYPWNHQIKHWVEPRFNRALRERSLPPHHLLGSLVEGTNLESPTWRHTLRISESPWTRDHAIQSNVVYPAAGYICLAIEAVKQLQTLNVSKASPKEVSGYRLRDVDFLQALMIPDTSDGIEIQTSLRPVSDKDVAIQGWKHFEVWTVTGDNRWTQHAKGLISIEFEASGQVSPPKLGDFSIKGYKRQIPPTDLFANLKALGIGHGPVFQNMRRIVQSGSDRRSVVLTAVPDTSVPNDLPREHVLHPVTLDSFITSPYSAVPGAASRETAAKVPRSVKGFWVSNSISHVPEHVFKAHSHIIRDDKHGMEADVIVANDAFDDNVVLLEMKGFSYQSLGRSVSLQHAEPWESQLCSSIHWRPDISVKLPATLSLVKKELSSDIDSVEDETAEISRLCIYFMQKALDSLSDSDFPPQEPHYSKYYAWMKSVVQQASSSGIEKTALDQIAKARADGEMIRLLGSQLVHILRGELTPADVMEQDKNLLSRFYSETPRAKRTSSQLSGLLRHLVHKNPRARIIEIGASTGGVTGSALGVLGTAASGGPHASLYHYTDISDRGFDAAREAFGAWAGILAFDVFDVVRDPADQGFTLGSYDVVIASHTISSTTAAIDSVLDNIRSLIKPGGTLLLTENVTPSIEVQFIQGLFPSWWSSERSSEQGAEPSPLFSVPLWDRSLRQAGFTGIDIELRDSDNVDAFVSATVMSTLPPHPTSQSGIDADKVVIVISEKAGNPPSEWLRALQHSIAFSCTEVEGAESKALPSVQSIESTAATAAWYADKICIFVGEVNEPILHNLDAASLEGIKAMSTGCKGLLWVTRGGAVDCERPEVSLATGFVRALRNEYVGRKFITLDLSPKGPLWQESGHEAIAQVLQTAFGQPLPGHGSVPDKGPVELEYAERDGVILIPRVYHDVAKDIALAPRTPESEEDTQGITTVEPFHQQHRPLAFQPELLVFGDDLSAAAYKDTLPPRLVEVMPRAYGAVLHSTDKTITGQECSGIITRVGSEASKHGYSAGNRVICLLQKSSFPSRAIVDWTSVVHMPPRLSFQEAASLPAAFLVAYFSLVKTARLSSTQTVLIHNGAGSIGQAAIMVAKHIGATVFTTVASPKQRDLLATEHGVPSHHIFDSNNASFGSAVIAATNGRGVDVVLNSLTGPLLQTSFNLVAPLGHFIEVSTQDALANSNLEMLPFTRGVSFSAVDISSLLQYRTSDVHRCLEEVVRLLEVDALAPVSHIVEHNMADIAQVSRLMQTEDDTGKRVLSIAQDETVSVLPRTRAAATLSPEASYLIVGGNGGLGQAVAYWMVSRGAKNLVLLSRSAGQSPKMAVLAEELREAGCHRVLPFSCDVSSEDDLARAMDTCAQKGLPPIRGVVHAAFVLHDSFVENMTLDDYKYTIQSKVSGAWNLHNQFNLPGDLDFFVLFSSINGILGYASQAAYSAAGAYEDALAHWRVKHQGLPAVSIDLSLVDGVGYVAEATAAEAMRKSLIKAGRRVINEEQVLASLELAIASPFDPQFILGGINSGPGPHWDVDGDLGRDMRLLALKYRQSAAADGQDGEDDKVGSGGDSLSAKIASASSRDEAILVVGSAVAAMLADMFLVSVEEVDLDDSPSQQGIDSLVAVEVRNMLFSQAGAELSIFNIMQSPSLAQLVADVVDRSTFAKFAKS
ncbi:Asperfuranone polyketide synthase [Trichoderma ghanense]|uniref:Asperfuranone polyketide synthase n=1 Tax=Trichoderma ghanense TaxID=65468 RepID=A0ABY2HBF1_9HYPO